MRRRAPKTMAEQAAANLIALEGRNELRAVWDASKIVANVWSIAKLWSEIGHMPTQREYCERWDVTPRTAQRHWAEIKLAFPPVPGNDGDVVEQVASHMHRQLRAKEERSAALSYAALDDTAAVA